MSSFLVSAAKRQISRYGSKGAAILTTVVSVEDKTNLTVVETDSAPINLLSFVGSFPSNRIDGKTILSTDRKVLAVPDDDWDGTLNPSAKITIDSVKYSIEGIDTKKINGVIAYIEVVCRG